MSRRPRETEGTRPSALVLAAGESSRFLGTKQLTEVGGKTVIARVIDALPREQLRETLVVLGHDARGVGLALPKKVKAVINREYRTGMASSIRIGLLALSNDSPGVLLVLADQPLVTRRHLRKLLAAYSRESCRGIVASASQGVISPPAIFSREYFPELLRLRGDKGAKSVIERHAGAVSLIEAPEEELSDVDTREDLKRLMRLLKG